MSAQRCLVTGFVFVFLFPVYAGAQYMPGQRRMDRIAKPAPQPFSADGTVQSVAPGMIHVVTDNQQNWLVNVAPNATVQVTGKLNPNMVRNGMYLRFDANIEGRNVIKEKITSVTVITPVELGIWPQGEAPSDKSPSEAKAKTDAPKFGGFGDDNEAGQGRGKGAGKGGNKAGGGTAGKTLGKTAVSGPCTIIGQVTSARKGKLALSAGRASVKIELADDATVDVDSADYTVASKGDKVKIIEGRSLPTVPGRAQATKLTIEMMDQPLPSKKPEKANKAISKRAGRSAKADASEPEPEQDQDSP